ncbi:hypothetical protein HYH02_002763 [Chlamydomonas schloesseri]|uniref:non-specific serine/threonine protein kinase n=1 Tax=Chlamydomonas schloesseri TaxID=2026947 RepID=A0A836BAY5_9CHLO|nr:hypothetical protein HYH02_002763 [Chlamydomonas schloesseri]|eukprot:KAG2452525.1 hypothetical protein HYH02_002763 [Chlamydomonas schloesseri]
MQQEPNSVEERKLLAPMDFYDERSEAASLGTYNDSSEEGSSAEDSSDSLLVNEYLLQHGLARCVPVRLLGQGAMGRVELVHIPPPPHQPDAPPIMAARKTQPRSADPHLRAKEDAVFGRELEGLTAGRGSPFFVRPLAMAAHADRQELLLELAEGETLEEELSEALSAAPPGPLRQTLLSPERIANLAASLLAGLVEMHGQGLSHMDIKPPNLLLTREGRLLIGDTGCAARADADGNVQAPLPTGTPVFAAPETRAMHGVFHAGKADIFSVGTLLAVCCAWHRTTGRVLAWQRGDLALPDFIPAPLADLISQMTAKDPARRPTAREALAHPFLAGVDVAALAPLRCPGLPPR